MRLSLLLGLMLGLFVQRPCIGNIVGSFTGNVLAITPVAPFSTIGPGASIIGDFIYDPNTITARAIQGCDCIGYRQRISGGFLATVGNTQIRADDYLIIVGNDVITTNGVKDLLTVSFESGLAPPLTNALSIDNVSAVSGLLNLTLYAHDQSLFDKPDLPASLSSIDFDSGILLASEPWSQTPDVFGAVSFVSFTNTPPGDYNFSGLVDLNDYAEWRRTFGSVNDLTADGSANGIIDAADYVVWRDRFNAHASSTSVEVPEPASGQVFIALAGFLIAYRSPSYQAWE